LIKPDLTEAPISSWPGKKILNIFPSIDTPVCAASVRTFHERAAQYDGVTVINVSKDLPFAQKRFCASEGIENAANASCFRSSFADDFGVRITGGALTGLCARAVVVVDEHNQVLHSELVPEISHEPNYEAALSACKVAAR
jgi:thiol peroxidase